MENELIVIEEKKALQVFTSGEVDPIIAEARKIVNNFKHDLSTGTSRARTASLASKVSKFKVKIDGLGKELVADWKAKSKTVDDSRKKLRDELDALRDEARKPLTDWENEEKERVIIITEKIEKIKNLSHNLLTNFAPSMEDLQEASKTLESIVVDETFEEFEFEATKEHKKSTETIDVLIKNKQEALEQDAEFKRLREEQEEREKKDREDKLKKEAAEEARLEAEEKARIEKDRIEQEKQDAIKREEEAKLQAEEAERKQIEAEERAKIEKEQAEQEKIDAKKLAKLKADESAEEARQEEIQKQKYKEEAEKAEVAKREADREHTGKIRKEAKECLLQYVDELTAKKIILAIDQGRISNVSINY